MCPVVRTCHSDMSVLVMSTTTVHWSGPVNMSVRVMSITMVTGSVHCTGPVNMSVLVMSTTTATGSVHSTGPETLICQCLSCLLYKYGHRQCALDRTCHSDMSVLVLHNVYCQYAMARTNRSNGTNQPKGTNGTNHAAEHKLTLYSNSCSILLPFLSIIISKFQPSWLAHYWPSGTFCTRKFRNSQKIEYCSDLSKTFAANNLWKWKNKKVEFVLDQFQSASKCG